MQFPKFYLFSIIISSLLTIISVYSTWDYKNKSVYNDLRTRVTGTRLIEHNKSAYFGKWQQGDPIYLQNATANKNKIANGNTVTPTFLLLTQKLFSNSLSYIKDFWYYANYLCFIGIFLLLYFLPYKSKYHFFIVTSLIGLFAITNSYKMHFFTGQAYVMFTFLASLSMVLFFKNIKVGAGVIAGLLTTLRMPLLILFIPIILFKQNKKFTISYILTIVACVVLAQIFLYNNIWADYFSVLKHYALENAKAMPLGLPDTFIYPNTTEGVPNFYDEKAALYLQKINPDIFSIQRLLVKLKLPSTPIVLYSLYFVFCGVLFWMVNYYNNHFYANLKKLLYFALIVVLCFDYFIPAVRYSYNFVQLILLCSFILFFNFKLNIISVVLFLLGILLNVYKISFIPDAYSVGEVLCIFAAIRILTNNKLNHQNEVFELGWLGRNIFTMLGLHPKMGIRN